MTITPRSNPTHARGFTLVELMVAITITVILAALVFLGGKGVRQKADLATTINRLQGLAQANASYAADHNGKYIPVIAFDEDGAGKVQWHYHPSFLEPLIGDLGSLENAEMFEGIDGIPEQVLDPIVVREKKRYWSRVSASFGYNQENLPGGGWGERNTARSYRSIAVKHPDKTCQFITATDWIAKYGGRYLWRASRAKEGKTEDGKIAYRHQGKAVVAFYDGHVGTVTIEDMRRIDRRGGIDNAFWGGANP